LRQLQRECLPNFVIAARAEETRIRLLRIGGPSVEVALKKNQVILLEKMENLTKDNPKLLAALYHLSDCKHRYEEERKERFEESWVLY